jgi:hypothetical protein
MNEDEAPSTNKQEKLERVTVAKSMRNVEDILLDLAAGVELEGDEERLADRLMYEKHKQRVGKYKKEKKPANEHDFPILTADGTVIEPSKKKAKKITVQKEYEVKMDGNAPMASDVVVKAADFVS